MPCCYCRLALHDQGRLDWRCTALWAHLENDVVDEEVGRGRQRQPDELVDLVCMPGLTTAPISGDAVVAAQWSLAVQQTNHIFIQETREGLLVLAKGRYAKVPSAC